MKSRNELELAGLNECCWMNQISIYWIWVNGIKLSKERKNWRPVLINSHSAIQSMPLIKINSTNLFLFPALMKRNGMETKIAALMAWLIGLNELNKLNGFNLVWIQLINKQSTSQSISRNWSLITFSCFGFINSGFISDWIKWIEDIQSS